MGVRGCSCVVGLEVSSPRARITLVTIILISDGLRIRGRCKEEPRSFSPENEVWLIIVSVADGCSGTLADSMVRLFDWWGNWNMPRKVWGIFFHEHSLIQCHLLQRQVFLPIRPRGLSIGFMNDFFVDRYTPLSQGPITYREQLLQECLP